MIKFRSLKESEIDVRVAMVGNGWCQLLLYKDARADMTLLDETVGTENWQREHYECKGNLFCKVGINVNYNDETKEPRWVWKSDCGSESNTEKEKGEASDSFKRACTNWGIGRELYTKIAIFVNLETVQNGNSYKLKNKERFSVGEILVDEETGKIVKLQIIDKNGIPAFNWTDTNFKPKNTEILRETAVQKPVSEQEQDKKPEVYINQAELDNILNRTVATQTGGKRRVKRED